MRGVHIKAGLDASSMLWAVHCLADGDYDGQPADIYMLGVGRVIIQLQFRLFIWIFCDANLHQWDASILKRCLHKMIIALSQLG